MHGARTPLIAGNWKMHKTVAEAGTFIAALLPRVAAAESVDVVICPAYLALRPTVDRTRGSRVNVYAQNMHYAAEGPFTGEVSAPMLVEAGVTGVILGHSERRRLFAESDRAVQLKTAAAVAARLVPILCVGETEEECELGETEARIREQVRAELALVDTACLGEVVIAYEPSWAIGTGPRGHTRPCAGRGFAGPRRRSGPLRRAGHAHPGAVRRRRPSGGRPRAA